MNFTMKESIEILERTPHTLESFLIGVSDGWLQCNEGEGTWNVIEVLEHLIEGEKTDWIPRLEIILKDGESKTFLPFDRFSHLQSNSTQSLEHLLAEFKTRRVKNLAKLKVMINPEVDLERTGMHPEFGVVKLRELIATWAVHDLTHISQVVRVMAERYRDDVGPWKAYLGILRQRDGSDASSK